MNIIEELSAFNDIIYFDDTHSYFKNKDKLLSGTQLVGKVTPPFPKEKASQGTANKLNKTQEDVLKMWEIEGKFSTAKGTFLHEYIENFYKNKVKSSDFQLICEDKDIDDNNLTNAYKKCVEQFHQFYKDTNKSLLPILSELIVGDSEFQVGGTIDQLFYSYKTGKYHIFDWKTNKQIDYYNQYNTYLYPPVSHLSKSKLNIYSIQLSIYRLILEKNTNIPLGDSFLVHFYEYNSTYQIHKCLDLRNEVNQILDLFQNNK